MSKLTNSEFRTLNGDAPVFPGKTNYWVIVTRDTTTPMGELAAEWARKADLGFRLGNLRALDEFREPPHGRLVQRVQPEMTLAGYRWITLQFDVELDGPETVRWPWDLGTFDTVGWGEPYSGLWAVYQPGQIVEVPTAWDEFEGNLERTGLDVVADVKSLSAPLILAGAGLLAYLAMRGFR